MTDQAHQADSMLTRLVIGSRRSELAQIQAKWVGARVSECWPDVAIEYRPMSTEGDRRDEPLPEIGGKGLFTRDLEEALTDGTIDVAVHSLKDLPTQLSAEVPLLAIPNREDPYDVLIPSTRLDLGHAPEDGALSLLALPAGAVLGTSSLRRTSQVRARRADLEIVPIRGNIGTRLARMEDGICDALILAAAGLRRLGRWPTGAGRLTGDWLPAPGQGALAVQGRAEDDAVRACVSAIDDPLTRAAVTAERAFLAMLEGGCQAPIAALARADGDGLQLEGAVYDVGGGPPIVGRDVGSVSNAEVLGRQLGRRLLEEGAADLVARARDATG